MNDANNDASLDFIKQSIDQNKNLILIDVRTREEYEGGHLEKSLNVPLDEIDKVEEMFKDKNEIIYLYCRSGGRSVLAQSILKRSGYKNIKNIPGGILKWIKMGYNLKH